MKDINAIVAVDSNWGIGKDNELLFHIKEDLQNFKKLTTGNIVIMGRKTWDSLPVKPLPDRTNVVLTRNSDLLYFNDTNDIIYMSDRMLNAAINSELVSDAFVIGGEQIYRTYLPMCNKAYVTKILDTKKADAHFPNLDKSKEWKLVEESEVKEEKGIQYKFCIYERTE